MLARGHHHIQHRLHTALLQAGKQFSQAQRVERGQDKIAAQRKDLRLRSQRRINVVGGEIGVGPDGVDVASVFIDHRQNHRFGGAEPG